MIEFYVSGQSLKFFTPVIAADSLNYLTAKVNFSDSDWDGYSKWLHFRKGEELGAETFDLQLGDNDEITAGQQLNLTIGEWEIYLTGVKGESRLTTLPVILTVKESGLIDAPLHGLPMSVAEQLDFNAKQALLLAQAVKEMADAGAFDGEPGTSFAPLAYFESVLALEESITEPSPGDVYGVGSSAPYDIYVWDGVNQLWVNNGQLQGAAGEAGKPGATFIPSVDANGNLSWSNDGGLENPPLRNISGPKGDTGPKGEDGKGPYEVASANGYTGTEATFNQALTAFPYHNARHLPEGADPIKVQTGNIADGAVTKAKLASDAKNLSFANKTVAASSWSSDSTYADYAYRAAVACSGVSENHFPIVVFSPADVLGGSFAPVAESYSGGVYIYAASKPASAVTIPSIVCLPLA